MAPAWLPVPDGSRDPRIEDPTNLYFVHLCGRVLLPSALRAGLSANAVSLTGLALGAAGAAAYSRWTDTRYVVLGFGLCLLWLIADGLDGMIARSSGTASAFGRFLDGVCDHVVFVLLYVSLAASIGTAAGWALAVAAGAAHALQATLYEGERTRFHRRIRGDAGSVASAPSRYLLVRLYDGLAGSLDRLAAGLDDRLSVAPDQRSFGEVYGKRVVAPLRMMSLLSNNMRVILIAIACLSGAPQWFWIIELSVLMVVLLIGILWLRQVEGQLVRECMAEFAQGR